MRRRVLGIAFVVAVASVAPATTVAVDAAPPTCTEASWVAGSTEWCDGWLVYRDHIYDDGGADHGTFAYPPPNGTYASAAAGDVDHTAHGQSKNSADLRVARFSLAGRELHTRIELNTLLPGDGTLAAVAVDVDGDPTTGGGAWAGLRGVRSAGWEHVSVSSQRNAATNIIEWTTILPSAPGATIRLQAVVALGDGTPMNVAFRTAESGNWWDTAQATALAGGDISAFGVPVAVADFGKAHRPAPPAGTGHHVRVYRSNYPLGEGIGVYVTRSGAEITHFGAYQPFSVYRPAGSGVLGIQLNLHGAGGGHGAVSTGWRARADEHQRIIVQPLGRGPVNWWSDWGLRDALDALDDVEANYPVDRDRVYAGGYSMGASGVAVLLTKFPDRFAAVMSWDGGAGDGDNGTPLAQGEQRPDGLGAAAPYDGTGQLANDPERKSGYPTGGYGNSFDYLENARHVASAHAFGAADELVGPWQAAGMLDRMADLGYEHIVYEHLVADHSTLAIYDDWRKEMAWSATRRVARRPGRVTYKTNSYLSVPEVGIVADGAYWVDGIVARNTAPTPDGNALADLTTGACEATDDKIVAMRNGTGLDPVPWVSQEGYATGPLTIPAAARISGTLTNVSEVTIDVAGACFKRRHPIFLDIDVDGPTTVRFSDGRPAVVLGSLVAPDEPSEPLDLGAPSTPAENGTTCVAGNTTAGAVGVASTCQFTTDDPGSAFSQGVTSWHTGTVTLSTAQPGCFIGTTNGLGTTYSTFHRQQGYSIFVLQLGDACTYTLSAHPDGVGHAAAGQTD